MAKPPIMQTLEKGKLLTGKNFPLFVDTWNFTVNRLQNLKGDRDTNPQQGKITVDNTDPDHPVIRYVKDKEKEEGVTSITGDVEGSEAVKGDVEITGQLDPDDENTSCGIVFRTVSEREETEAEDARKARVIAELKGRDTEEEGWGVHTLTYKKDDEEGEVHFLGNDDIDLSDVGGEETKNENVIGSDYIKVDDETEEGVKKRKVEAKVLTGATPSEEPDEHALITNDTVQKIVQKKTFTDANGTYTIVVDGTTGKVTLTQVATGKTIDLNPSAIPNDCNGTIGVHELKFKDRDNNTHTYHGLFCDDVDLTNMGKLIKSTSITLSTQAGGQNIMTFYYTDGTSDRYIILNGLNGNDGSDGEDGESPDISVIETAEGCEIYVDGEHAATLKNGKEGKSPKITATKTGKTTTIYADDVPIATIEDGDSGEEGVEQTFISDITFSLS